MEGEETSRSMIGYVRVSTHQQGLDGNGLVTQLDRMRAFAGFNGISLPEIYEDVASASGARSLGRRGDLRAAMDRAERTGHPILVDQVDRLSRDLSILNEIDRKGIEIHSVSTGRRVSKKDLRRQIKRAQQCANEIGANARLAHAERKARGVRSRASISPSDRRSGSIANMVRADRKVKELADFLLLHPDWLSGKDRNLVDHLNEIGLLNLTSEKHDIRKSWTYQALRKPLKAARAHLEMLEEDDEWTTAIEGWGAAPDEGSANGTPADPGSEPSPAEGVDSAGNGGASDFCRDHPEFGIF